MQKFKGRVAGVKVKPVDTTGAGDAFVGGLLYCLASDLDLFEVFIHLFDFFLSPNQTLGDMVRVSPRPSGTN